MKFKAPPNLTLAVSKKGKCYLPEYFPIPMTEKCKWKHFFFAFWENYLAVRNWFLLRTVYKNKWENMIFLLIDHQDLTNKLRFFRADHDISTPVWMVFRSEYFFQWHPGYEINTYACHVSKLWYMAETGSMF